MEDTVVGGAAHLLNMTIGPIYRCIDNSRPMNKTELAQKHIDECWKILAPIAGSIQRDRYEDVKRDIAAYVSVYFLRRNP